MKVIITALKAPWPEGAMVGETVELKVDILPAWALGKCTITDSKAKADHVYGPAETAAESADTKAVEGMAAAQKFIDDLRTAHAIEVDDLRSTIAAGSTALQEALAEADSLRAELQALRDKQAAESDDAKAAASIAMAEKQAEAERGAAGKTKK